MPLWYAKETHATVESNGIGCNVPHGTGDVVVSVVANGTTHEGTQIFRFGIRWLSRESYLVPHLSTAAARSPLLETGSTPTGFMSVGLEIHLSKQGGLDAHTIVM